MKDEILLSIDGSLSSTGYGIKNLTTKEYLCIDKYCTSKNKNVDDKEDEDNRITALSMHLLTAVVQYKVTHCAMESQFLKKNVKTALQLSRLRGALMILLKLRGIHIVYLPPQEVKAGVTGNKLAEKEEVAERILQIYKDVKMIQDIGPFEDRPSTKTREKTSDKYDAVGIEITYSSKRGLELI